MPAEQFIKEGVEPLNPAYLRDPLAVVGIVRSPEIEGSYVGIMPVAVDTELANQRTTSS